MARVWITDGSLIPFSDVHTLDATHRGPFGLRGSYKGLIDPCVPVGSAIVHGETADDVLAVEAEWVLHLAEGAERYLHEPDALDLSAPVVMQGMIEGKWLNRLLGTDRWAPATLGNNLLAQGPGIATSLGEIEQGLEGRIEVSFQPWREDGAGTQTRSARLADLRGQNIPGLVRGVLRFCRDAGCAIDAVDLGAIGENAASVNERVRIRDAMRCGLGPVPNPLYFILPRLRMRLMGKVVRSIIDEDRNVPPDCPVSIRTYDRHGAVVGQGSLTWTRKPRVSAPLGRKLV